MRVRADQPPPGAYNIEQQPDKPGYMCVRLYENAAEVTKFDEDARQPFTFWEYDEYMLIVPDRPTLAAEIKENFDEWMLTAKSFYPLESENAELRQENEALMGVVKQFVTSAELGSAVSSELIPLALRNKIEATN